MSWSSKIGDTYNSVMKIKNGVVMDSLDWQGYRNYLRKPVRD